MPKTIFLLGAGASKDADFPLMAELTDGFPPWLEEQGVEDVEGRLELFHAVSDMVSDAGTPNIEFVLRFLQHAQQMKEEPYDVSVAGWKRPFNVSAEAFAELRRHIESYIREALALGDRARQGMYLSGLFDFLGDEGAVEVFTLNYDRLLEGVCLFHDRRFTTGFADSWDPHLFEIESVEVKIYKLHGSVDWFRFPSRGLIYRSERDGEHFAFSEEKRAEVLLYPAGTKAAHAEPFASLMAAFTGSLSSARYLVAIGYSFADAHIRRMVLDQMVNNRELNVIVVGPEAEQVIEREAEDPDEPTFHDFRDRVAGLWYGAEYALANRLILSRQKEVDSIENAIQEVRESRSVRRFELAAHQLIQVLEEARRTDLPGKGDAITRLVQGEEFLGAVQEEVSRLAGIECGRLGVDVRGQPHAEGAALDAHFGDAGEFLAVLVVLHLASRKFDFEELARVTEAALNFKVKQWVRGFPLIEGEKATVIGEILDPRSRDTNYFRVAAAETEQFERELKERRGFPLWSEASDSLRQRIIRLRHALPHLIEIHRLLKAGHQWRKIPTGSVVYVAHKHDAFVRHTEAIMKSKLLDTWALSPEWSDSASRVEQR